MNKPITWKQERPSWCPHPDCEFKRRTQDAICGGKLPEPQPHNGDFNTHRFCINESLSAKDSKVIDLQVNNTDLDYFRWIFDALDGKVTSWLSKSKKDQLGDKT